MNIRLTVIVVLAVPLAACLQRANVGDPALKPYDSMYSVDRAQYGFTPLPKTGTVTIEGKSSSGGYDALLSFEGNPCREIFFRWDGKAYQWLGEQETFEGPRMYETPDGRFNESVTISFFKEKLDSEFQGLTIDYRGPDEKLSLPRSERPTLDEVNPLLEQWGFRK